MNSITQETWDKLIQPTGDKLVARPALPEITPRLFCAVDASGCRHLLIPLIDTEEEFNDPLFRAACRKYREIQESARDIKLIRAAQNKVDELIDYFNEGSDLQERDPITGKPIFKAKDVIGEMSSISKVLDELDALEARIKKKQKAATGLRAGAVEGYVPKLK